MRIRKEHRIQVSSPRKRKQVESDKPSNRRKFRASPLSDDTTSEASVTTEERKPQENEQNTPPKEPSPVNKIAPQPPQPTSLSQLPYSGTTLPPLNSLPTPSYNPAPLNVSIHREPLTGFPLFQQVMPDIAQYHLSSTKPYSPEASPQFSAPNDTRDPIGLPPQEKCRPGYHYPSDPFESRNLNSSSRPLFP
ncbi:hypothetical protein VKS41_001742 [Umbelopsis sp. WA50703]